MTPLEVFDAIRERALTMTQTAFMESDKPWPDDEGTVTFMKTMIGLGVAAASEHYAAHPEHLAFASAPICSVCREPVQSLQVGVDPAPDDSGEVIKVAWPCGHRQAL